MKYKKLLVYLKIYNHIKNIAAENISSELRLKNVDETRNYLIEEINRKESTSQKHQKDCWNLNYFEHILILASTITVCVPISAFASLAGIPIGNMSSSMGLKMCVITARIKKYKSIHKSIIKKKKKKHDKIVLSAKSKSKLNSIEVLISKALISSVINHDEFALINSVLK